MDLDKILTSLNEESDINTAEVKAHDSSNDTKSPRLTAQQQTIVRNLIVNLPSNISSQVKTLLSQDVRWMTFEQLLKALIEIIASSGTKTVSVSSVPSLNKSLVMKQEKME